jgi:hypothetical protein
MRISYKILVRKPANIRKDLIQTGLESVNGLIWLGMEISGGLL